MPVLNTMKNIWSVFRNVDRGYGILDTPSYYGGYSYRPDRTQLSIAAERSIINSVYNRISVDAAAVQIIHAQINENGQFEKPLDTPLNRVLNISANKDQTGRALIQDIVLSMLDEGCVAVVPTETDRNIDKGGFTIYSMRVGKIIEWYPNHVKVELYDERKGVKEQIIVLKDTVAIIENPFFSVMNAPNSTLQRLIAKLNMLDAVDKQSSSGKLDIILQLPHTIRSELRQQQAEERRAKIEQQLMGSKYGIAYIDGTEHITQLNRPSENNLLTQITYLTSMLYNQLGMSQAIFDGTADEKQQLWYMNGTIEPILSAITDEMTRKFLTKTAITQGQAIIFVREPFKLVPVNNIADIADKFTRNEILSSNELRALVGFRPSKQPGADDLRNKNLNMSTEEVSNYNFSSEEDEYEEV